MRTLGDIVRMGARRHPAKVALEMRDDKITYAELNSRVNCLANALIARGVVPGDRVAIMAENGVEFVEVALASAKAGAILAPLNFRYGVRELEFVLNDVVPGVVFTGPGYGALVGAAIDAAGLKPDLVALGEAEGGLSLASLRASGTAEEPQVAVDPSAAVTVLYTSGTTGHPKGVVATHEATMRLLPAYGVEGDLNRQDRMLICMPIFHGGGLVIQLFSSLSLGATVVLTGKGFDADAVLALVEDRSITITLWSPTMLAMLVNATLARTYNTRSLRKIWYGSSSILPHVLEKSRTLFEAASFYQWYGTTEATSIAILRPEDHIERAESTGREIFLAETRVVDDSGGDVAGGDVGEIVVAAGITAMAGYYNNPEATAATIRDGWLHTGDLATRDDDGYYTIVGRASDLIITGGENVYPGEVEVILAEHGAVADVAVFGVADEIYGEAVAAAVVVRPGHDLTVEELLDFASVHIARYKLPKLVTFVDELPRNASGKVVKRRLSAGMRP
jgi:fatty-acyl-CoA synthase